MISKYKHIKSSSPLLGDLGGLLFLSSRLQLSDAELEEMNELIAQVDDWDKVVRMMIARQAGPFLYKKLLSLPNRTLVPASAMETLRQSQLKTLSRNMMLSANFQQVVTAFNQENIPVIAMKGIFLSEWLYQDISLRQCSDIDLLVKPADGERALEVMRKIGYISSQSGLPQDISLKLMPVHYPAMIKGGVSVEIHTRLHSSLSSCEIDIDTLWKETVEIKLHGVMARAFRLEHLLITLIQHLDKHFSKSQFQFTGFYDISNLLDLHGDSMDIEFIQTTAEAWKLKTMILDYCTLVHKYFNVSVPEKLLSPQLPEKLEEIFLNSIKDKKLKSTAGLTNYKSIAFFDTPAQKMSYILRMTFPRPAYLMKRYQFNNKFLLLYYYPYRFLSHVKTAFIVLGKKVGGKIQVSTSKKIQVKRYK